MSLLEGFTSLGLVGLFLASLLGHFSIVMKDVVFLPLFIYMTQFWNPLILGLAGGLGGGLGELGIYLAGRSIGKFTLRNETRTEIPSWAKKLGVFSVLLASLTPLPDAPILLLLGSANFPILPMIVLELLGKTVLYTFIGTTGVIFYSNLTGILPAPWDSVVIILSSLSFSIIVTWKKTRYPLSKLIQNRINKIVGYLTN